MWYAWPMILIWIFFKTHCAVQLQCMHFLNIESKFYSSPFSLKDSSICFFETRSFTSWLKTNNTNSSEIWLRDICCLKILPIKFQICRRKPTRLNAPDTILNIVFGIIRRQIYRWDISWLRIMSSQYSSFPASLMAVFIHHNSVKI